MPRRLSEEDRRVWSLHMAGKPPSEIARLVGTSAERVRAVVAGVWRDDAETAVDHGRW